MSEVNYEWVKEQMTAARLRRGPGDAVLKLLKFWEEINLTPDQAKEALEAFSKIAQGHSIVPENKDEVWVTAQGGQVKVGDQVRVKSDAFEGKAGQEQNGRPGRIVAIRTGRIVVRGTDTREPVIDGVLYFPQQLDVRIR